MSVLCSTDGLAGEPDFERCESASIPPCKTCGDCECDGGEHCPASRYFDDDVEPLTLRGEEVSIYLAACAFLRSCEVVKGWMDDGLSSADLEIEIGDAWRAARRLLVVAGVDAIDPMDTVLLAASVARQIIDDDFDVSSVYL